MSITPRLKIVAHDLVAFALGWALAVSARFNFELPPDEFLGPLLAALPVAVLAQASMAWRFGLYRGLWRFASLRDLWSIIRAVSLGTILTAVVLFLFNRLEGIPRSVIILYPFFLVFLLGGPRLAYRAWKDRAINLRTVGDGARVIVIGGGSGAEGVVRDMLREGRYLPVGIVDDDPGLIRSRIHGVPVLGRIEDLPALAARYEADTLVIAIPSAGSAEMQRIVALCEACGVPFRTLPPLNDMVSGRVSVQSLREVSIDDLLGRDKVELDWASIQSSLAGKAVLVTGGGGSIGSELCRQLAGLGIARLVIFERSEHNLYLVERELRASHPHLALEAVIGDVCDPVAVEALFSRHRPALVFHAAAYKHVPILETQLREAARNNVLGTLEVANAALRASTESFVLISTDKAVRPSSVMGATKRLAELVCDGRNGASDTKFITVRFGNVLGSAGSVVPLFREQIAAGGPVTVTHPDARRYFMTIPEACQLILEAASVGEGGEIFVLDMGQPVNITYLAEQMIRLSGRVPGEDVEIRYTGLRAGEKLAEELFRTEEQLSPTRHEKLLLAQHGNVDRDHVEACLRALGEGVAAYDTKQIETALLEAVPDYGAIVNSPDAPDNVVALNRRQQ